MDWKIVLTLANGLTDTLYCASRTEARERARWYKTNCEPDRPTTVIKAVVRKA